MQPILRRSPTSFLRLAFASVFSACFLLVFSPALVAGESAAPKKAISSSAILQPPSPLLAWVPVLDSLPGQPGNNDGSEESDSSEEHGAESDANPWLMLIAAFVLLAANGFFVAAEFALVKVRVSRVEQMVVTKRLFSKSALWLAKRLEMTLSACQLGITMASLALGMVGEPAVAALLEPLFKAAGFTSPALLHTISFTVGFTVFSSLHLVVGEQAPKVFAIRQPETMLLWCALPMRAFYCLSILPVIALNASTNMLLGLMGMKSGEHEVPYTEEEIRALLREAHIHGNLTKSEANLLDAVFEFDDMVCRRIMLPRGEAEFIDINKPNSESIDLIRRSKHSRYPVCDGSLDEVLGVLHVKDLIGRAVDEDFDFKSIMRPPKKVPESMQISTLLRHFRGTHQLMAFVLDEHGTVVGIVTLENVLEEIIGDVADEFDTEDPQIVPEGPNTFVIDGATPVEDVEKELEVQFEATEQDTMAGLLMHYAQRIVHEGEVIELTVDEHVVARAKVLEESDDRAKRMRLEKIDYDPEV